MFVHNLKYTIKSLFKNKVLIFWTFAFPIILGIFFNMAFSNIEKDEKLQIFDIAVVNNKDLIYKEALNELSNKNNKDRLFNIKYVNQNKADKLLDNSSAQLLQANTQLTEGAQTINDGATTLADGIATFNEEGIQKICNFVNGDLKDLTTRAEKLTDLAKSYNSFTMVEDGVESNSKFVMIIDAVKKQEATSKQEYIVEDNNKQN